MDDVALTNVLIDESMRRAENAICSPMDDRCYGPTSERDNARTSRTR